LDAGDLCCGPTCGNVTAYTLLHNATAHGVKAVDASLQVGGPATAQLAWIPEFLALVTAPNANVPLDFVSTHLYPSDPTSQVNHTRDGFMQAIAAVAQQVKTLANVPLLITEFNAGLGLTVGPNNNYPALDVAYAGSFLLHQHLLAQSVANLDSLSFWTFTDFGFEEQGANPVPFANKFGIRNNANVPKPSYRAMQFIAQQLAANQVVLPVSVSLVPNGKSSRQYTNQQAAVVGATADTVDVSVSIQVGSQGNTIAALVCNYDLYDSAVPPQQVVNVTLTGLASGAPLPTTATLEVYDSTHGNPYSLWHESMGAPVYPTQTQIAAIMQSSQTPQQTIPLTAVGATSVNFIVALEPYAFARITITTIQS
jgi:xylan 1,4-beta-xylosidase